MNGLPLNTDGASGQLLVGRDGGAFNYIRRAVLRFDVNSIPNSSKATVTSAQLSMNMTLSGGTSSTFDLHRLTQSFTEGSVSGGVPNGAACTTGTSWTHRNCGNNTAWSTSGGSYDSTRSVSLNVGSGTGTKTWTGSSSSRMVTDIRNWRAGSWSNNGWLVKTRSEGTAYTARVFESRSGGSPPTLTINYTCNSGRSGSSCNDTNGCASNPCNDYGDNSATCADVSAPGTGNTCWYGGSPGCGPGYELETNGTVVRCAEVDPCVDNNNPCNAATSGRSTDTNADCIDDNPPSTGYSCSCSAGWYDNGTKCVEYDECTDSNNPCNNPVSGRSTDTSATCSDLPPSAAGGNTGYTCNCSTGWYDDGTGCVEYDPCIDNNNPCNDGADAAAGCIDAAPGAQGGSTGYSCSCSSGYADNGTLCVEYDACSTLNNPCDDGDDPGATCTDDNPPSTGYSCNCRAGFQVDMSGHCVEVNPCTSGNPCNDNGDMGSTCVDDDGNSTGSDGSTCVCSNGYELQLTNPGGGDPIYTCVNIDGCSGDPCAFEGDFNSTCADLAPGPGVLADGFSCTSCGTGYTVGSRNRSGDIVEVCTDFDACAAGNACDDNGDPAGNCEDESPPSVTYRCNCGSDYTEDAYPNATCLLLDGCTGNPCDDNGDTSSMCTDGAGTDNTCVCSTGYITSTTGPGNETCVDEDRCVALSNPCNDGIDTSAGCIDNEPGAAMEFTCVCSAGYELDGNGQCVESDPCAALNPCDDNGDTSSVCHDSAPPNFGHTCSCSNGYESITVSSFSAGDDIVTCSNIDGCAGNPCGLEGDSNAVCADDRPGPAADPDGFTCTSCGAGYVVGTRDASGDTVPVCTNFDACAASDNPCNDGEPSDPLRDIDTTASCVDDSPPSTSYSCACSPGFSSNGTTCIEDDPCITGNNPCNDGDDTAAVCVDDDPGSSGYACTCSAGYVENGTLCVNYDACQVLDNPCDDGDDTSATCVDDPPEEGNGFTCTCSDGFQNDSNGDCIEINPCHLNVCGVLGDATATCNDDMPPSDGSQCDCTNGYAPVEIPSAQAPDAPLGVNNTIYTCQEIDGCNGQPCAKLGDLDSICEDLSPGPEGTVLANGYRCASCGSGYFLSTIDDGHGNNVPVCEEFDACGAENPCDDGIDPSGTCVDDAPPSNAYTCVCGVGFADNGVTCVDFDGCADEPCAVNGDAGAGCTDLPAPSLGNDCDCTSGYVSAGPEKKTCLNVDGCTQTDDPCDDAGDLTGVCIDAAPPATGNLCRCSPGFRGQGDPVQVCLEIDGCVDNPCDDFGDSGAVCEDEAAPRSGNQCLCSDGFVAIGSHPTVCVNSNTCAANPCASEGDTDSVCVPTSSGISYTCACGGGFEISLAGTNERCVDIDECRSESICPVNSSCQNTVGGYECICGGGLSETPSGCQAVCGDGLVAIGFEECDNGVDNSNRDPDACRLDCVTAYCGDGVIDAAESCDDGPENGGDTCRIDCSLPTCGDGRLDGAEQCDNGVENSNTLVNGCRTTCVLAFCGDGVVDLGETCDNGSNNSDRIADACRTNCEPASCGDGTVDENEVCDDGNENSDVIANRCRTDCRASRCGDGVQDSDEECDLGPDENSTCTQDCRAVAHTARPGLATNPQGRENSAISTSCRSTNVQVWAIVLILMLFALRRRKAY